MKEICIIIVILVLIIGTAIWVQSYLNNTTEYLLKDLKILEKELISSKEDNNRGNIVKKGNEIRNKWNKIENGWAIIILHDELDMIETSLIKMSANIEYGTISDSIEELENLIFLVEHISDKEEFNLKNIF
ncbi:MAG: DUF4363 family protein [Clostridia bacterium]